MRTVTTIEWCVKNERFGTRQAIEQQLQSANPADAGLSTRRYACLDLCDVCARRPFVLLNNRPIEAATACELSQRIRDTR
ncbi:DUF1450 domain-containing protein [Alicyclobacillus acidiphilus]|uniref:DUF1450 domain-containing protein n=1 Tax=Alicyclobacillus acidiphilus TaxID=182455 RepID=UPI00082E223F|nr:DUF1450 domain-containing protein [Alicyclobacillus acidiphilus]